MVKNNGIMVVLVSVIIITIGIGVLLDAGELPQTETNVFRNISGDHLILSNTPVQEVTGITSGGTNYITQFSIDYDAANVSVDGGAFPDNASMVIAYNQDPVNSGSRALILITVILLGIGLAVAIMKHDDIM